MRTMPMESLSKPFQEMIESLHTGETVQLLGKDGMPDAVIVSVRKYLPRMPYKLPNKLDREEWMLQWRGLAQHVSQAWVSEKTALETLLEMRR